MHPLVQFFLVAAALAAGPAAAARGDEGMWLFNNPPKKELQQRYDFAPPDDWYAHLQRASVRFNSGGSGSFVSADGLVLTNHHVGADALQKLSTPEKNYVADGFYARTRAEELKCPDLELNVLMSIEDVTARVNAAVRPGSSLAEAEKARRAVMNTIEQESIEEDRPAQRRGHALSRRPVPPLSLQEVHRRAAGLRPRAGHRLLRRRSGQLRVSPLRPGHLLLPRLRERQAGQDRALPEVEPQGGVSDGELVFVSGHPGRTDRLDTVAHLEFLRDTRFPFIAQPDPPPRGAAVRPTASGATRTPARPEDELFEHPEQRARPRLGGWPACRTRP